MYFPTLYPWRGGSRVFEYTVEKAVFLSPCFLFFCWLRLTLVHILVFCWCIFGLKLRFFGGAKECGIILIFVFSPFNAPHAIAYFLHRCFWSSLPAKNCDEKSFFHPAVLVAKIEFRSLAWWKTLASYPLAFRQIAHHSASPPPGCHLNEIVLLVRRVYFGCPEFTWCFHLVFHFSVHHRLFQWTEI